MLWKPLKITAFISWFFFFFFVISLPLITSLCSSQSCKREDWDSEQSSQPSLPTLWGSAGDRGWCQRKHTLKTKTQGRRKTQGMRREGDPQEMDGILNCWNFFHHPCWVSTDYTYSREEGETHSRKSYLVVALGIRSIRENEENWKNLWHSCLPCCGFLFNNTSTVGCKTPHFTN